MVAMTPREALGIMEPTLEPEKALTKEQLVALDASPKTLAKKIRDGTASVEKVENYLNKQLEIPPELRDSLLGFLLAQKARLSLREDRAKEAAEYAQRALVHDDGSPANWLAQGAVLLWLERFDEATASFESAFLSRKRFGTQVRKHLPTLLKSWSGCALLHGLSGILRQDVTTAQKAVKEYLHVLNESRSVALESAIMVPVSTATKDNVPPELQAAIDELALMVRLLSIEDPFDGWRELSKEVSKVWPEGISAVDAIREQRA